MSVLYPIFLNRVQNVFVGQDARRLDELLNKALEFSFQLPLRRRRDRDSLGHNGVCHSRYDGPNRRQASRRTGWEDSQHSYPCLSGHGMAGEVGRRVGGFDQGSGGKEPSSCREDQSRL